MTEEKKPIPILPVDEMLEAIIQRLHLAIHDPGSLRIADIHALAVILKDTRRGENSYALAASRPEPPPEQPALDRVAQLVRDEKLADAVAAANKLVEDAGKAFERAYTVADMVWRSNMTNDLRQTMRKTLKDARRRVMRGDSIA